MLTCCHKIHMRFCLFPSMMFSRKFWKSMFGILRIQIGIRTKSMFGKLVLFPCLENIQFPHKFHTISIQNSNWEICQFFQCIDYYIFQKVLRECNVCQLISVNIIRIILLPPIVDVVTMKTFQCFENYSCTSRKRTPSGPEIVSG